MSRKRLYLFIAVVFLLILALIGYYWTRPKELQNPYLEWLKYQNYELDENPFPEMFQGGITTESSVAYPVSGKAWITRKGEKEIEKKIEQFQRGSETFWVWMLPHKQDAGTEYSVTVEFEIKDDRGSVKTMRTGPKIYRYVPSEVIQQRKTKQGR